MNAIDITLSILLLIGVVRGFMKGFIYEIAVLGVIFVCYFLGFKIATFLSGYIGAVINTNPVTLHYVSLFVAWIGISIAIFFLAKLLEGLANIVALGIFNKIAGAIFGGLKYAVVIGTFLFFLNKFNISTSWLNADLKADSHLYYPLLNAATTVFNELAN